MRINRIDVISQNRNNNINHRTQVRNYATNLVSHDTVNFQGKSLKAITKIFENYSPVIKDLGSYTLPVHNKKVANYLQPSYTVESFKKLFNLSKQNDVFKLHYNEKTGFFKTSLISSKENHLMADLVWVTDTARYMPVVKDYYPEKAVPLMENISHYYKKQENSMEKIIKNPLLFELNQGWPSTSKNGCGHVFNPLNYKSHKWYTRTRLESIGLYMQTIADLIKDGFEGQKYGYKKVSQISSDTIDSIGTVTKYLKSITYPYAKSCNSWEENTLIGTATSDTAIINEGFRKIMDLMYAPTKNKKILDVRKRIINSKNGDVFKDKNALEKLLEIGEYRIKNDDMSEAFSSKKYDAAMAFISHTEKYSPNVIKDIVENCKRLKAIESGKIDSYHKPLVRNNGIIRYNTDSYLNLDYDLVEKGNINHLTDNNEAEWFMVSDISKGYGIQLRKLLDYFENKPEKITERENKLKNFLLDKQTEYINRSYARITGENSYKANGQPCPAWQVPEAYQAVTTSQGEKFVPGTHTPLAWAQSSLYDASKLLLENLQKIEKIK